VVTSLEEQHRASSHALLQEFAAKLKSYNFACKAIAMRGDARDEIVRKVVEINADALVVGSRGLGALKRLV
ncbi:6436_t:CDS:2, partial [Racocetra persica]